VLDGELVGLDEQGIFSFNLLQNFRSAEKQIHYSVFDVRVWKGKSLRGSPLHERRDILAKIIPVSWRMSRLFDGLGIVLFDGLPVTGSRALERVGTGTGKMIR